MKKHRLGRTNLTIPLLGFGGIPIGERCSEEEAIRVLEVAFEQGIVFYDSARGYKASENRIGKALGPVRDQIVLATKGRERSRKGILTDIDASLRDFAVEYIDLYQLHGVDSKEELRFVLDDGGALQGLKEARDSGKVRFLGITGHNPDVLVKACLTGEFDTVQTPVNVVDRFIFKPEEALLPAARSKDMGVIAMKPLAGGTIKEPDLALRYTLSQDIDVAIPGMGSGKEVLENFEVAQRFEPLDERSLDLLIKEAKALGTEVCRQCGYCQPCPQGVQIREIFRLEGMFDRYEQKEAARVGFKGLVETGSGPENCAECGECEERCPYSLSIRSKLSKAAGKLLNINS